jgi:AcrR family transcriptional regulator
VKISDSNSNDSFLSRARYPKGRKRLKDILDATYEIITKEGLAAASQEAIAKRASVTQSAVRHYFPTKEELLLAFFNVGVDRFRSLLEDKLQQQHRDPREQLLDIVGTHYDWINQTEDMYFFESVAFWGRNPEFRSFRESWYRQLTGSYRELLKNIHPGWSSEEVEDTTFQLMTLVLGGWTTMGATRTVYRTQNKNELKTKLLRGVEKLID